MKPAPTRNYKMMRTGYEEIKTSHKIFKYENGWETAREGGRIADPDPRGSPLN
jgi:hypothetical protein